MYFTVEEENLICLYHNAAPQTAQRLISSRPLVISAHRAASSGRTATLNHRHSSE